MSTRHTPAYFTRLQVRDTRAKLAAFLAGRP
jgi:hypothetical protein